MSGMRYKVPMPSSLTIGTVRQEDDAALARVAEAGRRDDVAMATTK
ncbi:MAG: hypothetical protein JWO31_706 [Phycisphaerales bacterium]|nr:hypothetical protein [Phycisphaerales bacterium]